VTGRRVVRARAEETSVAKVRTLRPLNACDDCSRNFKMELVSPDAADLHGWTSPPAPPGSLCQHLLPPPFHSSIRALQVDRSSERLFFPTEQSLTYLDGSKPGDFGFDPLGLSDPEGAGGFIDPEWLRYGEIMNGRWAMLGAAGCVAPEVLGGAGLIPADTNVLWFKTGVIPPAGTTDVFGMDPYALFWIEVVLMQFAELRRWQDYNNPGSMGKQFFLGFENVLGGSGDPCYPGAWTMPVA
jgi:hypothetical protein